MTKQIIYLVISFILTAILGKIVIPILKKLKVGQSERLDGPRAHLKKQGFFLTNKKFNSPKISCGTSI